MWNRDAHSHKSHFFSDHHLPRLCFREWNRSINVAPRWTVERESRARVAVPSAHFRRTGRTTLFNLKLTGRTFHGEARVISYPQSGSTSDSNAAVIQVNAEHPWSADELRKVAALVRAESNEPLAALFEKLKQAGA